MTRTGELEGQLGMDAAIDRAGEEWLAAAKHAVAKLCWAGLEFSSDDVRAICEPPPNPNAWGALFRACANEGWIVDIGTTRSRRPDAHGRKVTRWRPAS